MELWSPVFADAEWIVLLRESLYGHSPLTPAIACDEQRCELRQWLKDRQPVYSH